MCLGGGDKLSSDISSPPPLPFTLPFFFPLFHIALPVPNNKSLTVYAFPLSFSFSPHSPFPSTPVLRPFQRSFSLQTPFFPPYKYTFASSFTITDFPFMSLSFPFHKPIFFFSLSPSGRPCYRDGRSAGALCRHTCRSQVYRVGLQP